MKTISLYLTGVQHFSLYETIVIHQVFLVCSNIFFFLITASIGLFQYKSVK